MIVLAAALFALVGQATATSSADAQASPSLACRDWRECRSLALEAAERRDYEAFHDLAWRTVQVGPPKDPQLMYLLARAQSLSGRGHDALIMVQRLAEMGVETDAATNDDFRRARALADWPEVEALLEKRPQAARAVTPPSTAAPASTARAVTPPSTVPPASAPRAVTAPSAAPPASTPRLPTASARAAGATVGESSISTPRAPDRKLAVVKLNSIEQAVRVSSGPFAAAGLAYDAVSRRFVVGDLRARKLMVVGERADHAVDLVRADSAGFHDIAALEIDGRRGDLWVVTASADADWVIHRMQLLSGRPLKTIQLPSDIEPLKVVDLALSPAGAVLALDAVGRRLLTLRPGATKVEQVARLAESGLTSVTTTSDERTAYVAHGSGISKIDLRTGAAIRMSAPPGSDLGRIERIRWHGNMLFAVQSGESGTRQIVRLELNGSGQSVTSATLLNFSIPESSGPTFATIAGDELSFVVADGASTRESTPGELGAFVIHRITLPRKDGGDRKDGKDGKDGK